MAVLVDFRQAAADIDAASANRLDRYRRGAVCGPGGTTHYRCRFNAMQRVLRTFRLHALMRLGV